MECLLCSPLAKYSYGNYSELIIIEIQKPNISTIFNNTNAQWKYVSDRRDHSATRNGKKIKRFSDKTEKPSSYPKRGEFQPRINRDEQDKLGNLIKKPEEIDSPGFNGLAGIDEVKLNIRNNFIIPLLLKDTMPTRYQKHMMLYGPPGTGKTEIAKAMAKDLGFVFYNASLSAISDLSGTHKTSEGVHAIFKHARNQNRPAIIFIDEADQVISRRGIKGEFSGDRPAKDAILTEMEGVSTQEDDVHVVTATNFPDRIDPAFISRARAIEVGRPDKYARKQIFKSLLPKNRTYADDWDLDKVVDETDGYTGREIRDIITVINNRQFDELSLTLDQDKLIKELQHLKPEDISMKQFYDAKEQIPARYDPAVEASIADFNNNLVTG